MKRPTFVVEAAGVQPAKFSAPSPALSVPRPVGWSGAEGFAAHEPLTPRPPPPVTPPPMIASTPMHARPADVALAAPEAGPPQPAFASPPPPSAPPAGGLSAQTEKQLLTLIAENRALAKQCEDEAFTLAVLIAKKIVDVELAQNLEALKAVVSSAIKRAGDEQLVRVRVSSADFQRLADQSLATGGEGLVEDPTLSPGDVMVETPHHAVDGRMRTRFDELSKVLEAARA